MIVCNNERPDISIAENVILLLSLAIFGYLRRRKQLIELEAQCLVSFA